MMITVLAGGVGAAKLLAGLVRVVPPADITAIVNIGDDTVMHGLSISPDLDTVTYTVAGAIDQARGWGLAGESWHAMEALGRFGHVRPAGSRAGGTWFGLGDRDLATHLYRTHRLAEGATLTEVTAEIAAAFGLGIRLLPACDHPVPTLVTIVDHDGAEREVSFQEYFVGHHHDVPVRSVRFLGADSIAPTSQVLAAVRNADVVVIAPSNPLVSIGPLLALPALAEALRGRRAHTIAVSPIVAGAALKGPADRMMTELGHDASVTGVARLYQPFAAALAVDEADRHLAPAVQAAGMRCVVTDTIMSDPDRAAALCRALITAVTGGPS